jgi:hypothetical protein
MYMEMSQGNFLQSYFKQKWFLSKMKNKKVKQVFFRGGYPLVEGWAQGKGEGG